MSNMRARNCKIIATLGPASGAPAKIKSLFEAGADCFRINFSHGDHAEHAKRIQHVRDVEAEVGRPITIIADMQGPKIRVGQVAGGEIELGIARKVDLVVGKSSDNPTTIPIPHPELMNAIKKDDIIKLDDGRLQLMILSKQGQTAKARVLVGGKLTDRKGINLPGRKLPLSALTDKDREDLEFALENGADFIALSFVQRPEDVIEAKQLVNGRARIISKIEKPSALDDIDKIILHSDCIMVARGDLGVELSMEHVPIVQRKLIRKSRSIGRPVIVATQMLESMITSQSPTRAETSDVATAVYQGTDAVMLSAETAVGNHPEVPVAIMDRVIKAVEEDPEHWANLHTDKAGRQPTTADAISVSARDITDLLSCQAIIAFTSSGSTAVRMARERPHCKVLGLTPDIHTARRISMVWGVHAVITDDIKSLEEMEEKAAAIAADEVGLSQQDPIIVTAGIPFGRPGTTNTLKIMQFEDV